ncbi:Ferric-anguibactin transport system permease protein FatD [compost metagenome]
MLFFSIPAILLTYLYANKFTVAGMGETFSRNLGLNYRQVVNTGLFCVSLTVSVVVITVGAIPFLGLVVPNIISLIYGDNLRKTLPYTALFGALFLLVCDIAGRLIMFPFEVPIGVVVGVTGGVLFLILLLRKR